MTTKTYAEVPEDAFAADLGTALEVLQAVKNRGEDDPARPAEMPGKRVEMIPNVFQVRGLVMMERHVEELLALLRQGRKLDPVTLWRCGRHALLVDGHHRLEAYRRWEVEQQKAILVPCQWFEGTAMEAMQEAAEANTKVKLPMTHEQRANLAWAMVRAASEKFSKAQVVRLSGVSDGTVGTMRKALKALLGRGLEAVTWGAALARLKGFEELTQDMVRERCAMTVERWRKALARAFGDRWYRQPDLAAEALDGFLGRVSGDVVRHWVGESEHLGWDRLDVWAEEEQNPDF